MKTHKYKIGDKVKIIKNIGGGEFPIGTIGKIMAERIVNESKTN
jgi:hypothetical protein